MEGPSSSSGVGIILLVTGIALFLSGLRLVRSVRSEADYDGIGGFRFNRAGMAWLAGYLLVISGLSFIFVGVMLVFV
jgi:hypothetical protein